MLKLRWTGMAHHLLSTGSSAVSFGWAPQSCVCSVLQSAQDLRLHILWFSLTCPCSSRPLSSDTGPVSGLPAGFPCAQGCPVPVFSRVFKQFLRIFWPKFTIISKSGRPSSGHRTEKGQSSSWFPRRAVQMNVQTTRQLHSSPMLARLYSKSCMTGHVNQELPNVQAGCRKGKGTRNQIANIHWIIEKAREFQKNIYLCFINYAKVFDCMDHNKLWKTFKGMGIQTILPVSWEACMQAKRQQLEQDMEQKTGSKLGKEYVKVVYCHPAYLTYIQSTSCKILVWMKHKLESRLPGEISTISDMQLIPV